MPVLPSDRDLGRANIEESSRPSASIQTDAIGSGMQSFAAGVKSFGRDMFAIAQKQKTEQEGIGGANADAYVAQKVYEREKELRDNPEAWEAWQKANPEFIRKVTAEAASLAPESVRAKWLAQRNVNNQRVLSQFEEAAREKHRGFFVAQTEKQIEENRRIAIDPNTTPERANEIIDITRKQFAEAVKRGFMSPEQAERNGKLWRENTAIQWLQARPPEERLRVVGEGSFRASLKRTESGGRTAVKNDEGYVGLYQFGAPRLNELGLYEGNTGPGWNSWQGTFKIPGFPEVKTLADFRANPAAQEKAADIHFANVDKFIKDKGLEKYIGETVGGVKITRDGMYAMAHLGGQNGMKQYLESGGKYNPEDSNKTKLSDYAKRFQGASGMGAVLDPAQQERVREGAFGEIARTTQANRTSVQRAVGDDITAIETTGSGSPTLTYERVAGALGSETADNWQMARGRAARVFEAFNGIEGVSNAEIDKRVEALRPVIAQPKLDPNQEDPTKGAQPIVPAGYKEDMQAYLQALQRAEKIKELRLADPAAAVRNDPDVMEAQRGAKIIERPDGSRTVEPQSAQAIMAARWQSQAKLGIAEEDRLVMTKKETVMLARRLREIGVDDPGALSTFTNGLRETYGEWADEVLASVIRHNNVNTELSKAASDLIMKVGETGNLPAPNKLNDFEIATERVRLENLLGQGRANNRQQERAAELKRQESMNRDNAQRQAKGLYDNEVTAIQQERGRQQTEAWSRREGGSPSPKIPGGDPVQAVTKLAEENAPKREDVFKRPERVDPRELEIFLTSKDPEMRRRFRAKYGPELSDKMMADWLRANEIGTGAEPKPPSKK